MPEPRLTSWTKQAWHPKGPKGRVRRARSRCSLPALLQELRDEPRPARLVAGADAGAVVAVEVLVERDQAAPVRVALEDLRAAVDGTAPVGAGQEEPAEPPRQ